MGAAVSVGAASVGLDAESVGLWSVGEASVGEPDSLELSVGEAPPELSVGVPLSPEGSEGCKIRLLLLIDSGNNGIVKATLSFCKDS